MKKTFFVLLAICLSISTRAQTVVSTDTSCSFLKNLKFKHGIDTAVIKGTLMDLIQLAPFTTYEEVFLKKHKISINKISNSEIEFQPQNCTHSFSAPLMDFDDKENVLDGNNAGISVIVTCVVFKDYLGHKDRSPYMLVIKVVPEKPIGSL